MTREPTTKCACGRDLHYENDETRRAVEAVIEQAGNEDLVVTVTSGRAGVGPRYFIVQRHYLALHGLKAQALLKGTVPGAREIDAATFATLNIGSTYDARGRTV